MRLDPKAAVFALLIQTEKAASGVSYRNRTSATDENQQFERGVAHFNAREFFEAHEVWEELWLRATEPEKTFLQGIIQVAAAFHHYQRGNLSGAKSLLVAGITKLGQLPPSHRAIDVAALCAEAQAWMDALAANPELGARKLPKVRTSRETRFT